MGEQLVKPHLRRATIRDAGQISQVISKTWSYFFAYSVPQIDHDTYLSTSLSANQISQDIDDVQSRWLVIAIPTPFDQTEIASLESLEREQEVIIGAAQLVIGSTKSCLTLDSPVELRRLYLDSNHHGGGLGKLLLSGVEEMGSQEGFKSIWLGVWEGNDNGRRFYEKMGFKHVGEYWFLAGKSRRRDLILEKPLGA